MGARVSWKRRTPAANRRRRHRRELEDRACQAIADSLDGLLVNLQAMFGDDAEALELATANLAAERLN